MEQVNTPYSPSSQAGIAAIVLLLLILFILAGSFFVLDYGYVAYTKNQNIYPSVTPAPGQKLTPVIAKGSFTRGKYTVTVTLNFLQEGGVVSGEFSGACSGTITGTYDGKDNGMIRGNAVGSCDPFFVPIPAKATFSGTVDLKNKTIPVSGSGSAAGFSGNGSLVFHLL